MKRPKQQWIKVVFMFEREADRTWVYKEWTHNSFRVKLEKRKIGALYVLKEALPDPPPEKITIQWPKFDKGG